MTLLVPSKHYSMDGGQNDTWLSEVARKLGEKMNQSIRIDLHQDLDQLLAENECVPPLSIETSQCTV